MALEKKRVILTCDTEIGEMGHSLPDAFEVLIEGKVDGKRAGCSLIKAIADRFGAKIEHFVDIYLSGHSGEGKFADLCYEILASGHKLGLHTHPSGKYDAKRRFMHQYSIREQFEIIKFGKDKIKEWTGVEVKTHRCGGYGVNQDTMSALAANGFSVDSSYFKNHQNCKLKSEFSNKPFFVEGVFEVPVTSYRKKITYNNLNAQSSATFKLDFRYGSSVREIVEVIKKSPPNSLIVIFLHSFNFLNLPYNFKTRRYGKISVNQNLIHDFEKLLEIIVQSDDCLFSSFDGLDLGREYTDFMPAIHINLPFFNFFEDSFKMRVINRLPLQRNI